MKNYFIVVLITALSQGCSVMPYQEESSCQFNGLGKCQSIADSYEEAVTGVDQGGDLVNGNKRDTETLRNNTNFTKNPTIEHDYQDAIYQRMKQLVEVQAMPLLQPALVRRVLILPYKSIDGNIWHESRHIYYIEQQPQWVLDKVNNKHQQNLMDLYSHER